MRYVPPILFAGLLALATSAAHAQVAASDGSTHGMVAVGAGVVPDYDGT